MAHSQSAATVKDRLSISQAPQSYYLSPPRLTAALNPAEKKSIMVDVIREQH
jgi:hypothetical protein